HGMRSCHVESRQHSSSHGGLETRDTVRRETQNASNLVPMLHKCADFSVCSSKRLFLRQENNSEVLGAWLLAEAGAVHNENMFLQQQLLDPNCVVFRNLDLRECVERPTRRLTAHPRN